MNKLARYMYLKKLLRHYKKMYRREKRYVAKNYDSAKLLAVYEDAIYAVEYRITCLKNERVPV